MRFFLAAMTIALLTFPVHAQGRGGGKHHGATEQKKDDRPTVSDKDYKAALDRIPNSNEKPDPWQNVRAAPKAK